MKTYCIAYKKDSENKIPKVFISKDSLAKMKDLIFYQV